MGLWLVLLSSPMPSLLLPLQAKFRLAWMMMGFASCTSLYIPSLLSLNRGVTYFDFVREGVSKKVFPRRFLREGFSKKVSRDGFSDKVSPKTLKEKFSELRIQCGDFLVRLV